MSEANNILNGISSKKGQIAILIDPEKCADTSKLSELLKKAHFANVNYLFVGGSTVSREEFINCVNFIKENSKIPLLIFPGASHQISKKADALLYLSLISGRNPDFLIGHHVLSASEVYDMDLEVLPTGYILIEGGTNSSVAYVSQTTPIPGDKMSIILNTAKAGILQGKKLLYFDAGSGAKFHVPIEVIEEINKLNTPIIVGGGIRTLGQIQQIHTAGANIAVIGNKIEEDIDFLLDIKSYIEEVNE
ncbi:MAG: geranylgeranylglyceryl/heptaprenylglyceryl phosphate synthase [Crocinitomicaceae bacterium]|nr:geranylgeranylglyceryl/heptaprenylglyceryl phosphate synthase [Crocinitomicaceae bacterium]